MLKERYAIVLILLALFSGMLLTAATSGCNARDSSAAREPSSEAAHWVALGELSP
jgi:hypothetical protein